MNASVTKSSFRSWDENGLSELTWQVTREHSKSELNVMGENVGGAKLVLMLHHILCKQKQIVKKQRSALLWRTDQLDVTGSLPLTAVCSVFVRRAVSVICVRYLIHIQTQLGVWVWLITALTFVIAVLWHVPCTMYRGVQSTCGPWANADEQPTS